MKLHLLQQKPAGIFRKLGLLCLSMTLLMTAFTYVPTQHAQAAGCATGEIGSADTSITVASADADSYKPWLQLKGNGSATVAVDLDGTTCFSQSVTGLSSTSWAWFAIGAAQPISAGNHKISVKVYTDGVSLLKGRLINDACVPAGDGSNCNTAVSTPTPSATQTPTSTPLTSTPTPSQSTVPTPTPTPTSSPTTTLSTGVWNDSLLSYAGSWSVGDNASGSYTKYLGSDHYSSTTGATASFKFRGNSVAIYGAKAPWHGRAEVSIDSVVVGTIDEYASTRSDQQLVFAKSGISSSVDHVLTIRVLGAHSSGSTGDTIAIDKVSIDVASPTPTPTPATPTPTQSATPTPTPTPTAPTAPVFKSFSLSYNWLSAIFLGDPGCTYRTGCQMTISWTAVAGATSYDVVRPGKQTVNTTSTSYVDTSVNAYGTYVYQVVAKVDNSTASSPVVSKYIGCAWIVCGVQ